MAWNVVDPMEPVYYDAGSAAFPLCEECFKESSTDRVAAYFRQLVEHKWGKKNDEWVETFRENVREAKNE
jgi:hypothetical protein